jgi:hypothetical protein
MDGVLDYCVGAFDSAANGAFVHDLQHPAALELLDVAIQARLGDIAQMVEQFQRLHRPADQGLDDAEPGGVEQ